MSNQEGSNYLLIAGESGSGKSVALMNLENSEGVLYLNCEGGKPLPYRCKFKQITITDPKHIPLAFTKLNDPEDSFNYHTVIIDTVSFMMNMYESKHVVNATNTQKAWQDYGQFFANLINESVAPSNVKVIFLAHTVTEAVDDTGESKTYVPVKGALKKASVEAFFTTVVATKKVPLKELRKFPSRLLNITDLDEAIGYKHVFQLRTTKNSTGDRIRTPMGLFKPEELYMDNDVQMLIDELNNYYS